MSSTTIIYLLFTCIGILILVILYQYLIYRRGMQRDLKKINCSLEQILDTGSDEKVMVVTDNKVLMDLLGQLNRVLEDRQKMAASFRHSENSSKKMLSNISHDIKTPLTVILGYLEIMRMQTPEDETLIKVEKKANQVMGLINQFFSLAKLEAGDTVISITKVNINEICREAILDFYGILSQDEWQVDVAIPERELHAMGNRESINRVLFNLISNAIRYGSDGKYLGISVHADVSQIYIDVIDHGKGIEKDFASSIFERLYTMEDSRNRKIQGNGLGLTIARNLAQQMGGDVYVESVPHNKTTFTLQLKQSLYE